MGGDDRVKLLCSFGGDFIREGGKPIYYGGKTRLVSIDRSSSFRSLMMKMAEVSDADPNSFEIMYQLPDGCLTLDSRLISVENDDDVRYMIDEFAPDRKVPIFLFSERVGDDEGDEDYDDEVGTEDADDGILPAPEPLLIGWERETATPAVEEPVEEPISSQSGPSASASPSRRDDENARDLVVAPNMALEMFRKDSQSLVVGQEYEDVQTFRNALTSAAIAANFELHMIRSDQRRVTARCAVEGCTWRVHASRISHVTTFRIRTLVPEHTCERSGDAGHRQATTKWIANCIREKLRLNRNYKPKEILNDIHREYGVLITYKRAFLAREKALEELRNEPLAVENNYELTLENTMDAWGEIHDPPRNKRVRVNGPSTPDDPGVLHCTWCNQIGHNRRTCNVLEFLQGGQR